MARCGCGGGLCNCTVQSGTNVTVSGTGSAANPYVISADVPCEDVRGCLSAGDGITFDQATGVIAAGLSSQAGNNIAIGPDGGLLVPTAGSTVAVGCGLTGDGSGSAPLQIGTGTWPYPCPPETAGGVVVCGPDGILRGEPRGQINYTQAQETRTYADLAVPADLTVVDTFTLPITNPDQCRPAVVLVEREVDVDFVLPAGAGASYGHDTDQMFYTRNTGSSTITDAHTQTTKLYQALTSLAPGAGAVVQLPVTMDRGSGGATYNRIQTFIRAIMISL
ncbi:LbetaH domain-containing protein [Streptomyces collinus]